MKTKILYWAIFINNINKRVESSVETFSDNLAPAIIGAHSNILNFRCHFFHSKGVNKDLQLPLKIGVQ